MENKQEPIKKPTHDVPFDHDVDDFDHQFNDDIYEKVHEENLDQVRGSSELANDRKVKIKGQRTLMLFLILVGVLIASAMTYRIISSKKNNAAKKEEPKAEFTKPQARTFGQEFAASEPAPYEVASASAGTQPPIAVTNNPIRENTSGVRSYPPATVEPPSYGSRVSAPIPDTEPAPKAPAVKVEQPQTTQASPVVAVKPAPTPEELRQQRLYNTSFSVAKSGTGNASTNNANEPAPKPNTDPLVASLMPATLDGTAASRMKDRDFIITKGNMIDCVLDTKFDSTVVGMVTCSVTRNIYGASGRVVLIDRGSKVVGEYKGGIQQGQNRVFIVWTRIETPKGVIININSPGAGSLGEAGLDGRIDSKFLKRFGGAMLMSFINDAGEAIVARQASNNNGTINFQNSNTTAQQMTTAEIEKSINIPPSLIKHQGDRLSIYVARDVYFGGVYELRNK